MAQWAKICYLMTLVQYLEPTLKKGRCDGVHLPLGEVCCRQENWLETHASASLQYAADTKETLPQTRRKMEQTPGNCPLTSM